MSTDTQLSLKDKAAAVGLTPVVAFVETPEAKADRKRTQNADRQKKHREKLDKHGLTQGVLPKWLDADVKAAGGWDAWKTAKEKTAAPESGSKPTVAPVPGLPKPVAVPATSAGVGQPEGHGLKFAAVFMAGLIVGMWLNHFL